jgi:hypothetical protein
VKIAGSHAAQPREFSNGSAPVVPKEVYSINSVRIPERLKDFGCSLKLWKILEIVEMFWNYLRNSGKL